MSNKSATNEHALSQNMEDYLEAILLICAKDAVARVKDIAARLDVKKSSVISAVKKLSELDLLVHEHYGYVKLTEKGKQAAQTVRDNHILMYEFFTKVLGVDEETADHDACMMEHYISQETRLRLTKFIDFVKSCPGKDTDAPWLVNFRRFVETGEVLTCTCDLKRKVTKGKTVS